MQDFLQAAAIVAIVRSEKRHNGSASIFGCPSKIIIIEVFEHLRTLRCTSALKYTVTQLWAGTIETQIVHTSE